MSQCGCMFDGVYYLAGKNPYGFIVALLPPLSVDVHKSGAVSCAAHVAKSRLALRERHSRW